MAIRVRCLDGTHALWVLPEEEKFLAKYGIDRDLVFDATGLKLARYGPLMKAGGYVVAGGVSACKLGHQMRNRFGKCVQCQPESLTYASRFSKEQHVYVGYSKASKLIKIGTSDDLEDRFEQLNIHQYGECDDWVILESAFCNHAGRIEKEVQVLLEGFQVSGSYGARPERCRELFRCPPSVALAALRRAVAGE